VQAPITAFVIVLEMTANQQMTIPIMATSMLAYAVSRLVCRRPLYGTLARRFLIQTEPTAVLRSSAAIPKFAPGDGSVERISES
jgi:H+/Cl- antiporter ClcA